ncbi:tripartite tricarboxylate transporter TctB family protein [Opitutia bacterium ISCC 51]|nr:tripartite tricarboxylate transporter TctB family protein [Opitutae bacterium ISCC 51]QXD27577.1 tripartite tricarboxylate transporter TctB family protein [Opitutae bacterium ISCC 52]
MRQLYHSVQDYIISAFTIVLAGLVLWGARDIPPPFFDPLGSAAVPKAVAYILIALAAGIAIRRFFQNKTSPGAGVADEGYQLEPLRAIGVVGLSILYTLGMGTGFLGFRWGTILYITITGALLAKGNKPAMMISLALGLLFGLGGSYLFSEIFYIDLP